MRFVRKRAFTLIELLVVMSIITMLMAILLPCLGYARERARRVACMANLRSIGQGIYVYANDNDGLLIPGDYYMSWYVWRDCGDPEKGMVNLGHLLTSGILPIPTNKDNVYFCPSGLILYEERPHESFKKAWCVEGCQASISYMFNEALDGFGSTIQGGERAVLSHKDRINFLRGDGSVRDFKVKPLVFDEAIGPELLQEVTARYEACFPTIMLHEWLEQGEIDMAQAREYLNNPSGWMDFNCTLQSRQSVLLANAGNKSLACDAVGYPVSGKFG